MSSSGRKDPVHRTGLTIIYEPEIPIEPVVDIVFIHGLQGHPKNTWTKRVDEKKQNNSNLIGSQQRRGKWKFWSQKVESEAAFWPKDFLPEDCPNARIITWGYDSNVSNFFDGSASKNSIISHAGDLLGDLNGAREFCADRKLIFVAHSLGGIVVKQMLLNASRSVDPQYREILTLTNAIFFLGTPHAGSSFAKQGDFFRGIVKATGFDTANQNLNALKPDNALLDQCRQDFFTLFAGGSFKVFTFQEAQGLKGISFAKLNDKVVPDSSSEFLGSHKNFTINANHREMCRYSTREDDGYKKLSRELRLLCPESGGSRGQHLTQVKVVPLSQDNKDCLDTLMYKEMDYREQELQEARTDSCNWILNHKSYLEWLDTGRGLLGIKGKPGSGKSTAMKKIYSLCNQDRKVRKLGHIQLAFFFHRRGAALQYSPLGMFRSLLYQLLRQIPSAGAEFWDVCDKKRRWEGDSGKDWDWRMEELRHLFSSALMTAAKDHDIRIFLDALDEAGDQASRDVVSYIYHINEKLQSIEAATAICFSCRHFPVIQVHGGVEICVEDNNGEAIETYTASELKKQLLKNDDAKDYDTVINSMQTEIVKRAAGVFMWVALVVSLLAVEYNNGGSLPALHRILSIVPSDLSEVYKHVLTKVIDPAVRPRALHILQLIYVALRPLSVEELRLAMISDDVFATSSENSRGGGEGIIESYDQMKKLVLSLSGGLAEVKSYDSLGRSGREATVQFIHQSVNDFIFKDRLRCIELVPTNDHIALGHHRLSRSCINYLRLAVAEQRSAGLDDLPFIHYATRFWTVHATQAESLGISQEDLLERFEYPSHELIFRWVELQEELEIDEFQAFGNTLLHIAAASNLLTTVLALLQAGADIEQADVNGNRALHHAARWGHERAVRILLDTQADVKAENDEKGTALIRAAKAGHDIVVRLLLDSGAVLTNKSGGPSVLHEAALGGNESIVRLFERQGADVNAQGGCYGNALQAAAFEGSLANIRLLLDRGADVNIQGGYYGNALQAAAFEGSQASVRLLLDRGADVNAQGGYYGNALQVAAAYRGIQVNIQLLLDRGADVNTQGGHYGNALQAAAFEGSQANIQLLLDQGADVNAQGGYCGNALQGAACDGSQANVMLLLYRGADVNAQGGRYGNALQAAAFEGSLANIRLLLDRGADVNIQGGYYGNALQAAARRGIQANVQLLLDRGADVNAQGGYYGTALKASKERGYQEIMDLLLKYGAVEDSDTSEDGVVLPG